MRITDLCPSGFQLRLGLMLFVAAATFAMPGPATAAEQLIQSVSTDLQLHPYVVSPDPGQTAMFQQIIVQFSLPQDIPGAMDPFNYILSESTLGGGISIPIDSITEAPSFPPLPGSPFQKLSAVQIWIPRIDDGSGFSSWLKPQTDYVLQLGFGQGASGNDLQFDEILPFNFRTPALNQVPEPTHLFVVSLLGAAAYGMIRRKTKR